jgi:hypothetical protein
MNQDKGPARPVAPTLPTADGARNPKAPNLSLEATAITQQGSATPPETPDSNFNPYNRNGEEAIKSAQANRSPPRQPSRIIVTSRKEPGLIHGLMEWISGRGKSRR